jgi:hypothetical protein
MADHDSRRATMAFGTLWLFVIFVSVVDGYLVVRHRHDMLKFELNPLGRALIHWNDGRVWYLLSAKFAGTVVACAAMLRLFHYRRGLGLIVAVALAAFQLGLLLFLLLY